MCMSRVLYDPKFGTPSSYEEISKEHAAYIEDMAVNFGSKTWEFVGLFDYPFKF